MRTICIPAIAISPCSVSAPHNISTVLFNANTFAADLRLEGYGHVRGIGPSRRQNHNIRAAWAEAEVFVFRQLRMGTHPDVLEREINEQLFVARRNDYKHDCVLYAQRILANLRNAGQFAGLPTFAQFEQIRMLRPGRARYEMIIYDRFRNLDVVSRFGGDVDIAREIGTLLAEYIMGITYLTFEQHELEL